MPCNREDLLRFVRAELDVDELERVLQHLEQCRECSDSLQVMVRLRANRNEFMKSGQGAKQPTSRFPSGAAWYAAAAAAVILAVTGLILIMIRGTRPQIDLARLAIEERYAYRPMVLRGDAPSRAELFVQAISSYGENNMPRARRLLEEYLGQTPGDAEAHFYLGVCCFLLGDQPAALRALEAGLDLRTIEPEEKYHWYLAQVHLKLRHAEQARKELRAVTAFHGEFSARASDILKQME